MLELAPLAVLLPLAPLPEHIGPPPWSVDADKGWRGWLATYAALFPDEVDR